MARKTPPLQVRLTLTRGAGPLSDQIAAQMRDKALEQAIGPGALVPSTRALAAALSVSRMTVDVAYAQLIAEGYLEAEPGSGTRVARQRRETLAAVSRAEKEPQLRRDVPPRAAALAEAGRNVTVQAAMPLAISAPNEDTSPGKPWTRIAVAHARRPWREAAYAGPHGLLPLRAQIADYVHRMRGITCSAEQVVVTAGTQQGLSLCARVLFAHGDRVWLEDPGYIPLRAVVQDVGLGIVPVPVDRDGINVIAGLNLAPDAAGAFVTPSHQYPLGSVLTMERYSGCSQTGGAFLSGPAAHVGRWATKCDCVALRSYFDTNGDGKLTSADVNFVKFKALVSSASRLIKLRTLASAHRVRRVKG